MFGTRSVSLSKPSASAKGHNLTFGPSLLCNTWQRSWTQNVQWVGKNSGLILRRLWTKVHEIFRQCRKPLILSKALADCLYCVSFHIVEKLDKCMFLAPNFLWGTTWTFPGRLLVRFTLHCLAKFGWVPFADPLPAKLGNEVESRIYGGWVKSLVLFYAVCRPTFMPFWADVGDPF